MNKFALVLFIVMVLPLAGCDSYDAFKSKLVGNTTTVEVTKEPLCQTEVVDCGSEFSAAIYYFDDDVYDGLANFIKESSSYLYCSFTRLDTDQFTRDLIRKNKAIDVQIIFDKDSTMDCESACIPYKISQYNELYAEGLDIVLVDGVRQNFCISEDGVFMTSSLLNDEKKFSDALYLKSEALATIYEDRFDKLWGESQ